MAGFSSGFASGINAGISLGSVLRKNMDESNLADAMKEGTMEDKTTQVEINKPDAEKYTLDSESGKYMRKAFGANGELTDYGKQIQSSTAENPVNAQSIAPQYETKTERVERQFASPQEKKDAMHEKGLAYLYANGKVDKANAMEEAHTKAKLGKMQLTQAQREEDYQKGFTELAKSFIGNTIRGENDAAMAQYNTSLVEHQKSLQENPNNPVAAPQKPALRLLSGTDSLHDATIMMQYNMQHGKVSQKEIRDYQDFAASVKKEVGSEALKHLHAGDIQGAIKSFDENGDMRVPKDAKIEMRKAMYSAAGQNVPTHELVITGKDGHKTVINAMQGLDAIDSADKFIDREFKKDKMNMERAHLGISGANLSMRRDEHNQQKEMRNLEFSIKKELDKAAQSGDQEAYQKAHQRAVAIGMKSALDKNDAWEPLKSDFGQPTEMLNKRTGEVKSIAKPQNQIQAQTQGQAVVKQRRSLDDFAR